jgi:hypothetical protein
MYYFLAPQVVLSVWERIKEVIPKHYTDLIEMYGKDKKEWSKLLLKEIDKDQLTLEFGGSNLEAIHVHELLKSGKVYRCFGDNEV